MNHDELKILLAAYVLGEASDEERARVEAALETSEELRAERARLEATIGLVREHLDVDSAAETLSPEAAAALERAAEQKSKPIPAIRPRPWYRSTGFRIAASITVVAGAWAVYEASTTRDMDVSPFIYNVFGGGEPDYRTAKAERRNDSADALRALGYVGADNSDLDGRGARMAQRAAEPSASEAELEQLRYLGYLNADSAEESTEGRKIGMAGGPPQSAVARTGDAPELKDGKYRGPGGTVAPRAASREIDEKTLRRLRVLGYGGNDGTNEPAELAALGDVNEPVARTAPASPGAIDPGATVTGRDEFFLGQGPKRRKVNAPAPQRPAHLSSKAAPLGTALAFFDFGAASAPSMPGSTSEFRVPLTPEQLRELEAKQAQYRRQELERILGEMDACLRGVAPDAPRDMFFRYWGDNPFEYTVLDSLSTFAADVDTASYALARRYLIDGHLPTKEQVRTEEFVNYFDSGVPAPTEQTFGIDAELAPSRFGGRGDSWMLRVVVRGKEVTRAERQPLTLTFVIDTSGSMKEDNRLGLVKHSLELLLGQLDARDSISIVEFSNNARLVLPMTSARHRGLIEVALDQLRANGGTNADAGLKLGYAQAEANLAAGTTNRVVFLSDGVANIGETDQERLTKQVKRWREAGIYLNTIGVGMDNHDDEFLEQLADLGDGICNYVDDQLEARRALVENFTGAFEPIARDVKLQVEFDPAQVEAYRLLGYENRAVADKDFRNDEVDAGELNAGHQVIALYELIRTGREAEQPLATVRLRWKRPYTEGVATEGDEVATEGFRHVQASQVARSFGATSPGYRKSVLVAQFAEFLRRSVHARDDSLDGLIADAQQLRKELSDDTDFNEFCDLLQKSRRLMLDRLARDSRWEQARDYLRTSAYFAEQTRVLEERLAKLGRERRAEEAELARFAARVQWLRERLDRLEASLDDATLEEMALETEVLRKRMSRTLELLREVGQR